MSDVKKKLSSQLPAPLHTQLKLTSFQQGQTVQDFVVKVLQSALEPRAHAPEELWLSAAREVLESANQLAIENLTSAIKASTSLLRISGKKEVSSQVISLPPIVPPAAAPKRVKKAS